MTAGWTQFGHEPTVTVGCFQASCHSDRRLDFPSPTMKLTFSWCRTPTGSDIATCGSERAASHGVSPLAHVLDDDGGMGVAHSLLWIEEGKKLALDALNGAPDSLRWSREYFFVEMDGDRTIAVSESDPSCRETLSTKAFLSALEAWQQFLAAGPASGARTIEIEGSEV